MLRSPQLLVPTRRPIVAAGGIPSSGLINQWTMDDAHVSGATVTDSEPTSPDNGTITGAVTSGAGPGSHTARVFDGVTGSTIITLASSPQSWTGAFSIGGWVWLDDNSITQASTRVTFFSDDRVGDGATNYIRVLNNTSVGAGAFGFSCPALAIATAAGKIPGPPGGWVHGMCTFDGASTGLIYIDGSAVATSSSAAGGSGQVVSYIGGLLSDIGIIAGRMYQWLVYNRALTAGEVLQIYNAQ